MILVQRARSRRFRRLAVAFVLLCLSVTDGVSAADQSKPPVDAAPSTEIADKSTCTAKLQPFPVPMLTQRERQARLHFLIKDTPLNIVERDEHSDPQTCSDILKHLQSFNDVTILEPTYSSWVLDPKALKTIAPSCPHLDLDSEYQTGEYTSTKPRWRPENRYSRDPVFLSKSRAEKESLSLYYRTATANFEYYDLSPYLGSGFWGYFAEGAREYQVSYKRGDQLVHNAYPKLHLASDSTPIFFTIEKVFSGQTCKTFPDPYVPVSRMTNMGYPGSPAQWSGYAASPNLFAFVDIAGTLYRINLQMWGTLNEMEHVLDPHLRSPNVFIDAVTLKDNEPALTHLCSFSKEPKISSAFSVPPGIIH